jgi:hypothetical protein
MGATSGTDRLEALRDVIAAGSYAPDPGQVAEAVLAWTVGPEVLEGRVKPVARRADPPGRDAPPDGRSRR